MISKVSLQSEFAKLPFPATEKWPEGVWDTISMQHGSMSLILFAPQNHDYQTPHQQDEIYVVFRGNGKLVAPDKTVSFLSGDVLFVPARQEHRFEEFSDDLILWAVFYGPNGGETN